MELVLTANKEPGKHTAFPICKSPEVFSDQLVKRRRLHGVPDDAITEIKGLQPYVCGEDFDKHALWVIDDLCNINKHRRLVLTGSRAFSANFETHIIDGKLWAHGELPIVDKEATLGPFPINNGAKVQMDRNIVAFIAFDEGAYKDMEVSLVLNEMLKYVLKEILPKFRRFFI
jgi:hypothetical protein